MRCVGLRAEAENQSGGYCGDPSKLKGIKWERSWDGFCMLKKASRIGRAGEVSLLLARESPKMLHGALSAQANTLAPFPPPDPVSSAGPGRG